MVDDVSNDLAVTKILEILQQFCIVRIVVDHVGVNPLLFIILVPNQILVLSLVLPRSKDMNYLLASYRIWY